MIHTTPAERQTRGVRHTHTREWFRERALPRDSSVTTFLAN